MIKSISILGSTGSIGEQTLDIAREHNVQVKALSANKNVDKIFAQILEFNPEVVSMGDENSALLLSQRIKESGIKTEVYRGTEGNCIVAACGSCEMTVASMVGIAGLAPVYEAIKSGKKIALANKETLVAAGKLITGEISRRKIPMYPVDSEHSAIWQCLEDFNTDKVSRLFLTASGGPFRGKKSDELANVTVKEALSHPTWEMGGKITIDSSTLMNKGLEVIEAFWLFGVEKEKIEVVVHPQSIIHSMVEFLDGSVMAQLGFPDMKMPIRLALTEKERVVGSHKPFNPFVANNLTFEKPDIETFKSLRLAYNSLDIGGSMPAVMNSANERAVEMFLNGQIPFLTIADYIEETMDAHIKENFINDYKLEDIYELDNWARKTVDNINARSEG